MADGSTTNYAFVLPEVGASQDTWGTKLNQNWSDLDTDLNTLQSAVDLKAPLASPALTGTPTAPTAATTTNTTQIATTAFVQQEITANAPVVFPSGTLMLFQQTAAPTGWTKQVTHNDKALRVVSGTVGSGGTTAFTTAFGTPSVSGTVNVNGAPAVGTLGVTVNGSVSATTLTTNQIPSHSHSISNFFVSTLTNGDVNKVRTNFQGNAYQNIATNSTGNSGSHTHGDNFAGTINGAPGVGNLGATLSSSTAAINVQYVDLIIASKD